MLSVFAGKGKTSKYSGLYIQNLNNKLLRDFWLIDIEKKHKYKSPFPVDLQSTESLPSNLLFVLTTLCSGRTNPIPISYVRMWMPEEKQAC